MLRSSLSSFAILVTSSAALAAARGPGGYEALYKCWRAVESEDMRFRNAPDKFGKLQDGIYFARAGTGLPSRVTVFHPDGITAFKVGFRRPPAHLVAEVGGKPVFHVSLRKDPKSAGTIVVDYLANGDLGGRKLDGKRFKLKGSPAGIASTAPIRERLGAQLDQMKTPIESERTWFEQEIKKQSTLWSGRKKRWQDPLIADIRNRLGPLTGVGACADLKGKLAEKAAPLVAHLRTIETLIQELQQSAKAQDEGQKPKEVASVPMFPGARLATEKEIRCLGFDGWQADYDVHLSFANAKPIEVADFYRQQLGLGPSKTDNGYRLVLTSPTDRNPMGDHIDIFQEAGKNPCTPENYTVRVSVMRRKGE